MDASLLGRAMGKKLNGCTYFTGITSATTRFSSHATHPEQKGDVAQKLPCPLQGYSGHSAFRGRGFSGPVPPSPSHRGRPGAEEEEEEPPSCRAAGRLTPRAPQLPAGEGGRASNPLAAAVSREATVCTGRPLGARRPSAEALAPSPLLPAASPLPSTARSPASASHWRTARRPRSPLAMAAATRGGGGRGRR